MHNSVTKLRNYTTKLLHLLGDILSYRFEIAIARVRISLCVLASGRGRPSAGCIALAFFSSREVVCALR